MENFLRLTDCGFACHFVWIRNFKGLYSELAKLKAEIAKLKAEIDSNGKRLAVKIGELDLIEQAAQAATAPLEKTRLSEEVKALRQDTARINAALDRLGTEKISVEAKIEVARGLAKEVTSKSCKQDLSRL